MATLHETIHAGNLSLFKIHAGGPGSGRKPGWNNSWPESMHNSDVLDNMHKKLSDMGYSHKESFTSARNKNVKKHFYQDSGGNKAEIQEHKNGDHKVVGDSNTITKEFSKKKYKV